VIAVSITELEKAKKHPHTRLKPQDIRRGLSQDLELQALFPRHLFPIRKAGGDPTVGVHPDLKTKAQKNAEKNKAAGIKPKKKKSSKKKPAGTA
jgi:hypothetical protein